jgi:hypothetical protein
VRITFGIMLQLLAENFDREGKKEGTGRVKRRVMQGNWWFEHHGNCHAGPEPDGITLTW